MADISQDQTKSNQTKYCDVSETHGIQLIMVDFKINLSMTGRLSTREQHYDKIFRCIHKYADYI